MKEYTTIEIGKLGEDYTVKYLKKHKFKIIERNMRNMYSEIDIIATNKEYIVFVEVKSRTYEGEIRPLDAVNKDKQKKILMAAFDYLRYNPCKLQPRFDIAEVFLKFETMHPYKINYIENAFTQGGDYAVF